MGDKRRESENVNSDRKPFLIVPMLFRLSKNFIKLPGGNYWCTYTRKNFAITDIRVSEK